MRVSSWFRHRSLLAIAFVTLSGLVVWGVLQRRANKANATQSTTKKPKGKFPEAAPFPSAEFCKKTGRALTECAGGKRVRLVWVETVSVKHPDLFTRKENLRLAGFDSVSGYHRFTEELGAYSRPILTSDGENIIYTVNRPITGGPEGWNPVIHQRSWDGKIVRELGKGFAVDTLEDPVTKEVMIYAAEKLSPHARIALDGESMVRFPLRDPSKREVVWTQTNFTTDNLQFSRDGRYFAAQFPWPTVGWGDLSGGVHQPMATGCWSSFAPDNSYLCWFYNGGHKSLTMLDLVAHKSWSVSVGTAPGFKNQPTYHPRWSNHPRFLTLTGPYPPMRKRGNDAKATSAQKPGAAAEVYFGRFSEKMDQVEQWVRVTDNAYGDVYPDAWIEDGETAVLAAFPQSGKLEAQAKRDQEWLGDEQGLIYLWENASGANEITGRHSGCRAIGRGIGRFNRHFSMLLDGGTFMTEENTTIALFKELPAATALTVEFLYVEAAPLPPTEKVRVAALLNASGQPLLEILRSQQGFALTSPAGVLAPEALAVEGPVPFIPYQPQHLAVQVAQDRLVWFLQGKEIASQALNAAPGFKNLAQVRLEFGQAKPVPPLWHAQIQNVAVWLRLLTPEEIASAAKASKPKITPYSPPVRLKVKLTEATEPDMDQLASYTRMLVDHTYEVVEVLEGKFKEPTIVVLHWAVLDRKPVPGIPRDIGQVYEVTVETVESHPEVDSELQITGSTDPLAPLYLDVGTPATPL